jgi:ADP-ribose pyrophosphatase YjhB (NUDIX family)
MARRYPSRPHVGVGAVVWKGDRVLLVKRGREPRQGQWSLPGGAQELGETVMQTLVREIREEAGIEISPGALIDVVDSIEHDAGEQAAAPGAPPGESQVVYHWTLVDFSAEWRAGELRAGGDALEARWFALAEISSLALWPETQRIIELSQR